jgi:hypothetical protein
MTSFRDPLNLQQTQIKYTHVDIMSMRIWIVLGKSSMWAKGRGEGLGPRIAIHCGLGTLKIT